MSLRSQSRTWWVAIVLSEAACATSDLASVARAFASAPARFALSRRGAASDLSTGTHVDDDDQRAHLVRLQQHLPRRVVALVGRVDVPLHQLAAGDEALQLLRSRMCRFKS